MLINFDKIQKAFMISIMIIMGWILYQLQEKISALHHKLHKLEQTDHVASQLKSIYSKIHDFEQKQDAIDAYFQDLLEKLEDITTDAIALENEITPQAQIQHDHTFKELEQKNFYTVEERKELFKLLGINYLNQTVIEYLPLLSVNQKTSEKYLANPIENDLLTELYGQDIAHCKLIPMSIRWLGKEIGHGIFAEEDTPAGSFIGIYGGVVQEKVLVENKDYAWSYPGETENGGKITLDAHYFGNELRFVNDGKDPNCIVKYIIGLDGFWHVCYVALKDIKKNEQLLVSYGPAYWTSRKYAYQEFAHQK